MKRTRRAVLPLLIVLTGALVAEEVRAQQAFTLADVSWLSGCWAGRTGAIELREHWTEADGGVMLANTRFLRDGAVVDWEFGRLYADAQGVVLWPYPGGTPSEHGFRLVRTSPDFAFENLEHDFPVRIVYARTDPSGLRVRIEGSDGRGQEWSAERVPCP